MDVSINSITSIVLLLFFIIRTFGIAFYFQKVWAIPLVLIYVFSIYYISKFSKQSIRFFIKESKWIQLSLFILIVNIIFKHGNFKLYETFKYLLFSVPFYIIGFYWGITKNYSIFRRLIVYYFVFISFYLLSKIVQVDNFSSITKETLGIFFNNSQGEINLNNLVFYWPFFAFVTIIGYILLWKKGKGITGNYLVLTLTIICIFSFIISGFAAPVVLILLSILIYIFLKSKSIGRMRLIMALPFIVFLGLGTVYLLGSGILGHFGATTDKSYGILLLIESGKIYDVDNLNIITSERWTAGVYSILQFIKSPIWGHGAYLETQTGLLLGNPENYTTAAGGHSFVLDTLAYYGIFGIPLILILYKFVTDAYKYYEISCKKNKFIPRVYTAAIASVFISNILNSTFLFSSFDNFVFLCSGFFLGKYYIVKYTNLKLVNR